MDGAGEGQGGSHAPGRQMFQLIRVYEAAVQSPNNWIIYARHVCCFFLQPVSNSFFFCFLLLKIGGFNAARLLQTAPVHLHVLPDWTHSLKTHTGCQECHLHTDWRALVRGDVWAQNVTGQGSFESTQRSPVTLTLKILIDSKSTTIIPGNYRQNRNSNHVNAFSGRMYPES